MRPPIRYRRNDASPLIRIRILPDAPGAAPLDRRVFGNFLEHLGSVVYGGVWAQLLRNPGFDPAPPAATDHPSEAFPSHWSPFGVTGSAAMDSLSQNNGRSLKLVPGGEEGGVCQSIYLPTHRTSAYVGSVWLRAETEPGTEGEPRPDESSSSGSRPDTALGTESLVVRVGLSLKSSESGGSEPSPPEDRAQESEAPLAEARIEGIEGEWRKYEFQLTLPPGALPPKTQAVFSLTAAGRGILWVDLCELFPADHIEGMNPEIVNLSREWHMPLLRYPGGNFASGYDWRDGVGPHEKRPTRPNLAWNGLEYNHFGTDEFMRFCEIVGAEPQICVNIGNSTPEVAAAWVEYCNGGAESRYGAMRAANGHPEPYRVRLWEVGNEIYGPWQIGCCDAEENAARYERWARAMREADPTIELIANGSTFDDSGSVYGHNWNDMLLQRAGADVESISLHPLVVFPDHMPEEVEYEEVYRAIMAHPWFFSETYLTEMERRVGSRADSPNKVTAAVTEWGLIIGGGLKGRDPLAYPHAENLAGAVYAGLFLNALLRAGTFVPIANITALLHGGGLKNRYQIATRDPQYWVQNLYADAAGASVVASETEGPGYSHSRNLSGLPPISDVPWLDLTATRTEEGRLALFVVNRHRTEALEAEIVIVGEKWSGDHEVRLTTLRHNDPLARNTVDDPDAVSPVEETISFQYGRLTREFPAHSVTVIEGIAPG